MIRCLFFKNPRPVGEQTGAEWMWKITQKTMTEPGREVMVACTRAELQTMDTIKKYLGGKINTPW